VIAVTVALISLEARDQHEGTLCANHPNDVAQNVLMAPLLERLIEPLGKPVVDHAREVLLVDAVVSIRNQELLRPNQADGIEQLRADGVVTGFASIQRQQRHARTLATAQHRQHTAVLVVGMRGRVHRARGRLKLQQLLPRAGCARVLRWHLRPAARRGEGNKDHNAGIGEWFSQNGHGVYARRDSTAVPFAFPLTSS
jgi:hypothetical protein